MDYRVEVPDTHERMTLPAQDWWPLLELASKYGWHPLGGRTQYIQDPPEVISASVTREIAEALERAVPDLPPEERTSSQRTSTSGVYVADSLVNPQAHFGGQRRRIVEDFIALCNRGDLRVLRE